MRSLTMKELKEQHGGILPPDAVLGPDDATTLAPTRANSKPGVKSNRRRTRSERFALLNTFVDFGIIDAELTPAEALVWLVLYRDTKAVGTARTAQVDVARRAGLDVRTVRRAVASLIAKGMLQMVRRGRLNWGPSTYRVHATRNT